MEIAAAVREVLRAECVLGEGPVWDAARGVVWFVDIKQQRLWRFEPATGEHAFTKAPGQIGWALPAEDGRLLCGLQDGLYLFDPERKSFDPLGAIPGELPTNRSNDACTDALGRVWLGTMDDAEERPTGRFYRFDRGTITPAGSAGIAITNGPAISPDSRRIYFTDTLGQRILAADLSEDGEAGEVRLFVDTAQHFPSAYPDGPVVDAEGFVWTGLYAGDRIARFAPDGRLDATVPMPTSNCTKLCFGGDDLRTVYVTTARAGLSDKALREQPLAGSLLAFEAPVAGFVPARVKLT